MREKLTDLLEKAIVYAEENYNGKYQNGKYCGLMANYLLSNGVIVLPCKVGDTVWIVGEYRGVYSATVRTMFFSHSGVEMVRTTKCDIPFHDFGKVAFFTREEAEKALERS